MKQLSRFLIFTALAAVGLTLGSCEWFVELILEPYAYVETAAGVGIDGVEVYLYGSEADALAGNTGDARADDTSDVNGYVGFGKLDEGKYYVSAVDPNNEYDFPTSIEVDMKEKSQFLGNIIGEALINVSGSVIDAKSTSSDLSAIDLTLINDGTSVGTESTDANGDFTFVGVDPGTYTISAAKSGFAFVDSTFEVQGSSLTNVDVLGFSYTSDQSFDVSVILLWDETATISSSSTQLIDLDASVTYPDGYKGYETTFDGPMDSTTDTIVAPGSGSTGFLPADSGRERVYYNSANRNSITTMGDLFGDSDTTPVISLDRDATDDNGTTAFDSPGGPETITIREIPFDWFAATPSVAFNITPAPNANGLPSGTSEYAWVGTMDYYVNAFTGQLMTTEQSDAVGGAGAEVFVVQGDTLLGRYTIPEYTNVSAAKLFRINMFVEDEDTDGSGDYSYFQIVPELELVLPGGSAFNPSSVDNGIIGARIPRR